VDSREARGQSSCPTGWTTAKVNFSVSGCNFYTLFCYTCSPTHITEARWITVRALNPPCSLQTWQVVTEGLEAMAEFMKNVCTDYPPCPDTSNVNMHIDVKTCVYEANDVFDLGGGKCIYYRDLWACGSSFCRYPIKICIDYTQTPPTQEFYWGNPIHIGSVSDCVDMPEHVKDGVPPPGLTDCDTWATPCFTIDRDNPCPPKP